MPEIRTPMSFEDLETKPPLNPKPQISDNIQQTLATLVGFDGMSRRLIKATASGILLSISPLAVAFINVTGDGANDTWQGENVKCSEVVIRANENNSGDVWVNVYGAAAVDTGWPLNANEYITLTINNLQHLYLKIVTSGDKAIMLHTL